MKFLSEQPCDWWTIMGDLNMNGTNWNNQTSDDPYEFAILELIDSYNLAQVVHFNTTKQSRHRIDHRSRPNRKYPNGRRHPQLNQITDLLR